MTKKVYVLTSDFNGDGGVKVEGVFSTKKRLQEYVNRVRNESRTAGVYSYVPSFEDPKEMELNYPAGKKLETMYAQGYRSMVFWCDSKGKYTLKQERLRENQEAPVWMCQGPEAIYGVQVFARSEKQGRAKAKKQIEPVRAKYGHPATADERRKVQDELHLGKTL